MQHSIDDAEIVYLVEYTPWWRLFYNKCKRPPTVNEMRAWYFQNEREKDREKEKNQEREKEKVKQ